MTRIVLPGEEIEEKRGRKIGEGVYEEGGKTFSKVIGIVKADENEISVIPLVGNAYKPKIGDRIIGIIREVEFSGWVVEINSPYIAFMPLSEGVEEYVELTRADLSIYYDVGDTIFCKISNVTKNKTVQVSMKDPFSKKLFDGNIIKISPYKIPRLIGRKGSMINMIKEKTKCEILAGQNGLVWIKGINSSKAINAIHTIEKESHISGLTERLEKMLSANEKD